MSSKSYEHVNHDLERLAKRLNSYIGAVAVSDGKDSIYLMVSHADYLILRQAYFNAMKRSSKRRLRNKLFGKIDYAKVRTQTLDQLAVLGSEDVDRPFLHMVFNRACGSKYALLKVQNIRHMEYLLYVRQSAFREALYRIQ